MGNEVCGADIPKKRRCPHISGADDFGDLGVGDHSEESRENSFHIVNFDHVTVDGLSLKSDMINILNLSTDVVAHLRARVSDDSTRSFVAGWGISRHSQLGDVALDTKRNMIQRFTPTPRLVYGPGEITELSLGASFLNGSRGISGLGSNRKGQLLKLESLNHVRHVACTWNGTYVNLEHGVLYR